MPSFFSFDLFLETKAEILKKICWFFGGNDGTKSTFSNKLTFTSKKYEQHTHSNILFFQKYHSVSSEEEITYVLVEKSKEKIFRHSSTARYSVVHIAER